MRVAPARDAASCPPTSASTPARRSSSRSRRTCTARSRRSARPIRRRAPKVVILGSGPNRIGQGIEFDYCCCHAAFALRDEGYETVMVNCNPETVSTDYDTVDRLYFEPLTFEDVLAIIEREQRSRRRRGLRRAVRRPDAAQARAVAAGGRRADPRHVAGLDRPRRGSQAVREAAVGPRHSAGAERHRHVARRGDARSRREIGFPVVVRPSYVLGGRAMAIVYDMAALDRYMRHAVAGVARASDPDRQVPRGRDRDRRRRRRRRQRRRRHRRHHGAHRAGRHPLRRQLLRGPAVQADRPPRRHRSATTPAASPAR